ncbi:MAG: NAD(P)H-dependent oxidoreductase [Deltaproteobacteria bacterium]|nr:NAD(P)H-dependent oxidoreductase [Deltaproteobacteria bacterium]
MKTLSVSYLPRGPRSRTKRLLDHFLRQVGTGSVEHLDLTEDVPPLFLLQNVAAYYRRNYEGAVLSESQASLLKGMDRLTAQLESADFVVLCYPMFNLSHPAVVKAWFDAVLQKGRTWRMTPQGYEGLLKGRRALVISTSASAFTTEAGNLSLDHSVSLSTQLLSMMGMEVDVVNAQGLARPGQEEPTLRAAEAQLEQVAARWYGRTQLKACAWKN